VTRTKTRLSDKAPRFGFVEGRARSKSSAARIQARSVDLGVLELVGGEPSKVGRPTARFAPHRHGGGNHPALRHIGEGREQLDRLPEALGDSHGG
jgi:hypothetical protein